MPRGVCAGVRAEFHHWTEEDKDRLRKAVEEVRQSRYPTRAQVVRIMGGGLADGQVKGQMQRMKLSLGSRRTPGKVPEAVIEAIRMRDEGIPWRKIQEALKLGESAAMSLKTRVSRYRRGHLYQQDQRQAAE